MLSGPLAAPAGSPEVDEEEQQEDAEGAQHQVEGVTVGGQNTDGHDLASRSATGLLNRSSRSSGKPSPSNRRAMPLTDRGERLPPRAPAKGCRAHRSWPPTHTSGLPASSRTEATPAMPDLRIRPASASMAGACSSVDGDSGLSGSAERR